MKTLLAIILLTTSSAALAWQPGELQESFSDIRAAQQYGRQRIEQQDIRDQQFRQQQEIEQLQQRQQQREIEQLQQRQQRQEQQGIRYEYHRYWR